MNETLTQQPYYTLSDGNKIPAMGFGVHLVPDGETVINAVKNAIKAGYRHIDTAWNYKNEKGVGIAIKECIDEGIVKREDLFITTKLFNQRMSYEEACENFHESLEKLGLDYVDMYLIHDVNRRNEHWKRANIDSWRAMEKLCKEGKIRSLGVSNYSIHHLEFLLRKAEIKPVVNQIELSPWHQQREVVQYCKEHDILVESWYILFKGKILKDPVVEELADKYNADPAQVIINWNLQKNLIPLVGSTNEKHIKTNFQSKALEISAADIEKLDARDGGEWTHTLCDEVIPEKMVPMNSSTSYEYNPYTYERTFFLFGKVPFLKERKYAWWKKKWYLFGFLPLVTIHKLDWSRETNNKNK